jgi:hypothetical protein
MQSGCGDGCDGFLAHPAVADIVLQHHERLDGSRVSLKLWREEILPVRFAAETAELERSLRGERAARAV